MIGDEMYILVRDSGEPYRIRTCDPLIFGTYMRAYVS